ncbi:unnamed protein product [Allacma fusca]|uniref:Uncharacterized protein n=1 Tax=Allacma fusca TaxID=39272 RepID=A0A8J2JVR7_9HEXA|nr:unnamed protein product [Allacma fusca]
MEDGCWSEDPYTWDGGRERDDTGPSKTSSQLARTYSFQELGSYEGRRRDDDGCWEDILGSTRTGTGRLSPWKSMDSMHGVMGADRLQGSE